MFKWLGVALSGTIAVGVGLIAYLDANPLGELQLQSLFFQWRGRVKPPENLVILAIDEISLSQGEFYHPVKRPYLEPLRHTPWKRLVYAQVIDRLMQAGAKVVAVDVLFTTPSVYGIEDDRALERVLQKYGDRVILAANISSSDTTEAGITQLETPADIFTVAPRTPAFVNFFPAGDGTVRHLATNPLVDISDLQPFATATLTSAQIAYPPPTGDMIYYYGGDDLWLLAGQQIPFYYAIEPANWHSQTLQGGKYFRDKIVLIGSTAPSQQDIQPSAVGRIPGVHIHAQAIASLMEGRTIREAMPLNWHKAVFVTLWLSLVSGTLLMIRRPLVQLGATIAIVGVGVVVTYGAFIYWYVALPAVLPVVGTFASGVTLLTVGAVQQQIEKLTFKRTLERYVAQPIVQQIVQQPNDYKTMMQGRTISAAVLFSDIRSFTTISSYLPPTALVAQLNEYMTAMVEVILNEQGTIDKFIGDAIMAEFGSPVSSGAKADALHAISAALGMRCALAQLRHRWQKENKIPFVNGIGIHYGEFTVGNIGSPRRMEYAVIGDTVNVASRVEGMTKDLGTDIAITAAVYELVKEEIEVIDCGDRQLKGRVGTVHLYSVVGWKGADPSLFHEVQTALQRNQQTIEEWYAQNCQPPESRNLPN
jgi:adenylate cyclase